MRQYGVIHLPFLHGKEHLTVNVIFYFKLCVKFLKNKFFKFCERNTLNYIFLIRRVKMGLVKKTTGLVGLAVAANPHHTLGALYGKILRTLQKMPEASVYRKYTEQIIKERAAILKQTKDTFEIETKINCGQAEELIVQAENELNLARKMLNWKPWEPLVSKPPKGQWDWPPTKA